MPSTTIESPSTPTTRPHLAYLDGLRGLAALFVMFAHSNPIVGSAEGLPYRLIRFLQITKFAHYGVAVFIVLSGYCLMLPVADTHDGRLRGGAWEYLRRRARRILPPYYVALGLSLLMCLIPLYHHHGEATGLITDNMFPAFDLKNIIAHILLLHNLSQDNLLKINSPFWSVAPEWQIYFFFPTVLLPVWRRFGTAATVATAFGLSYIPHFFFAGQNYLDWTCPWYLGLFSLGMAGAILTNKAKKQEHRSSEILYNPLLWLSILIIHFSVLILICRFASDWQDSNYWITDPVTGIAAIGLIIWAELCRQRNARPWLMRLLESRFAVGIGLFSYSLYLTHFPVLGLMNQVLLRLHPSPIQRVFCIFLLFFPLTIAISYLFFYFFERPFIVRKKEKQVSILNLMPPEIREGGHG